jgi:hypothetical protein
LKSLAQIPATTLPVAQSSAALNLDQARVCLTVSWRLAVIDRLDETRLDHAAFEEGPAPFGDRQVHHIGHHVDAGDRPAEAKRRHGVVMDLVF